MKPLFYLAIFLLPLLSCAQSDLLKGGELILNGISFLKNKDSKTQQNNSKVIESVCVKNKLPEKITFSLIGKS